MSVRPVPHSCHTLVSVAFQSHIDRLRPRQGLASGVQHNISIRDADASAAMSADEPPGAHWCCIGGLPGHGSYIIAYRYRSTGNVSKFARHGATGSAQT